MLLEFLMELCEIGFGLAGFVGAPRGRPEQGLIQSAIIPAFGQRPCDPRRLRAFQILIDCAVSHRATAGDRSLPQSEPVSESRYFFEVSHGQPFSLAMWVPPLPSGTPLPAMLSSVLRPVDPGQGSDHRRKVTGFIPESCPASFRNAARDDFGIVTALPGIRRQAIELKICPPLRLCAVNLGRSRYRGSTRAVVLNRVRDVKVQPYHAGAGATKPGQDS